MKEIELVNFHNPDLQALEPTKYPEPTNTQLKSKNPSEELYEGQIRHILSKHRVLTNDGWNDPNGFDNLVHDLVALMVDK